MNLTGTLHLGFVAIGQEFSQRNVITFNDHLLLFRPGSHAP